MKHVTLFIVCICCLLLLWVAIPAPVVTTAQDEATPSGTPSFTPTFDDYQSIITEGLSSISEVTSVEVTDDRPSKGTRIVTITHTSSATNANERANEWMAILQPLANIITNNKLDLDQVVLFAMTGDGESVGRMTASAKDLLAFTTKRMTRAQFLFRAKYISLLPTPTPGPVRPTGTPTNGKGRGAKIKIGVVTDLGRIDDHGFNQSTWEGARQAAKDLGGVASYIVTADPSDYAKNIQHFADQEYNVIITVGFALGEATVEVAAKYPKIAFIGVDQYQASTVSNVTGLIFSEEQAGFLAGILAARLTKSGTIAAVLGSDQVPPVVRYEEGYEAGAKFAKPDIKLISTYYPGRLDKAFFDPVWGAQTADQAIDQGADVVFGVAYITSNGALQEVAARTTKDKPLFCIGVDSDQWLTVPKAHPCLVSSAIKLISPGVAGLIKQASAGMLKGGNFTGDVGLAPYHDLVRAVPKAVADEITKAASDLKSGKLSAIVPSAAAPTSAPTP